MAYGAAGGRRSQSSDGGIRAQGLTKSYGDRLVLDGFDLTVEPGTVCALLGPNGAGKTTAVRILTTLIRPDAGTARVAGHDVLGEPQLVRARIGLVGQHVSLDEILTGRQNLQLFGRLYHLREPAATRRADELLGQFGLTDAADRPVAAYSGGMRRRLDLAASLIHSPPVILLDEPTTGVDPAARHGLWEVIRALVDSGTTVLLTTQYLEEADKLADQVVIVSAGRVVAHGTPDELKALVGPDRVETVTRKPTLDEVFLHLIGDGGRHTVASKPIGEART